MLDSDRYIPFSREEWADLRAATPLTIREKDLEALRGINEKIDLEEVIVDIGELEVVVVIPGGGLGQSLDDLGNSLLHVIHVRLRVAIRLGIKLRPGACEWRWRARPGG